MEPYVLFIYISYDTMVSSLQQAHAIIYMIYVIVGSQWKEIVELRSIFYHLDSQTEEVDIQKWYVQAQINV